MGNKTFFRIFRFPLRAIRGDFLAFQRFHWVKKNLPRLKNKNLLDVGCGRGPFSMYASGKGYNSLGLTWDKKDSEEANNDVKILNLKKCKFEVQDVRTLGDRKDLFNKSDVILCTENIEHIIDDKKLMNSMNKCLKKDGKLLLTAPSINYIPLGGGDVGPFRKIEDGGHVRKGYSEKDLRNLCKHSNFKVISIDYYGGYFGQKLTKFYRFIEPFSSKLAWIVTLPFKIFPTSLDNKITKKIKWPEYSICLVAEKK